MLLRVLHVNTTTQDAAVRKNMRTGIQLVAPGLSRALERSGPPLGLTLSGNIRVGTELFSRGPFSLRADVFGRLSFASRELWKALGVVDEPTPFAGGVAVMGVRSFD